MKKSLLQKNTTASAATEIFATKCTNIWGAWCVWWVLQLSDSLHAGLLLSPTDVKKNIRVASARASGGQAPKQPHSKRLRRRQLDQKPRVCEASGRERSWHYSVGRGRTGPNLQPRRPGEPIPRPKNPTHGAEIFLIKDLSGPWKTVDQQIVFHWKKNLICNWRQTTEIFSFFLLNFFCCIKFFFWSFERKTLLGDNPDPEKSELL